MKKKRFRKSTEAEIQKMLEMRVQGYSLLQIGQTFNKDRSTILWWLKKRAEEFNRLKRISQISNEKIKKKSVEQIQKEERLKQIQEEERLKQIQQKIQFEKQRIRMSCLRCKRIIKDKKWKLTHFCSLECWTEHCFSSYNSKYWKSPEVKSTFYVKIKQKTK